MTGHFLGEFEWSYDPVLTPDRGETQRSTIPLMVASLLERVLTNAGVQVYSSELERKRDVDSIINRFGKGRGRTAKHPNSGERGKKARGWVAEALGESMTLYFNAEDSRRIPVFSALPFPQFSSTPEARQCCDTDLERLAEHLNSLQHRSGTELVSRFFEEMRFRDLNIVPLANPLELYRAFHSSALFNAVILWLGRETLKILDKACQTGNPENAEPVLRYILNLSFHAGGTTSGQALLLELQEQLRRTSLSVPIYSAFQTRIRNIALDKGLKSYFQRSTPYGSGAFEDGKQPDERFEDFVVMVETIVRHEDWTKPKPSPVSERRSQTSETDYDGRRIIISLNQTLIHLPERFDRWMFRRTSHRTVINQVQPGHSVDHYEASAWDTTQEEMSLGVPKTQLTVGNLAPIDLETQVTQQIGDDGRMKTTFSAQFPQSIKSGEIYTISRLTRIAGILLDRAEALIESPGDDGRQTYTLTVGRTRTKNLVVRRVFPSWFPLHIITNINGVPTQGRGGYFFTLKRDRPAGKEYPYCTPELESHIEKCSAFSSYTLDGLTTLEFHVWADPETGFIPRGSYGLSILRPTLEELDAAWDSRR